MENPLIHTLMNKTLRMGTSPSNSHFLRPIFQHLFFSILKIYSYQKHEKDFTCYRGCMLSKDESNFLQSHIGSYIQMEGFTSAFATAFEAYNFYVDTWIEIRVKVSNLGP